MALLVPVVVLALFACGGDRSLSDGPAASTPPDSRLTISTERLDEPYRNSEIGITFRPPVGWQPLEPEQRDLVSSALMAAQEDGRYSLHLVDLFLRTETLSFAAISRVTRNGRPVRNLRAYIEDYERMLVPDETDRLRARTELRVNGITVTQFRHTKSGRISFTLMFTGSDGTVMQLDYSIPPTAYEDEGVKLESSVATLMHL